MILIIDNYDSFVFNVARYFAELDAEPLVMRNDRLSVSEAAALAAEAIVISPGPCTPAEAGISTAIVQSLSGRVPILGICLGHQCIGAAFGAPVGRALRPMHGRRSVVRHRGGALFDGLPNPLGVGRYHSLAVDLADEPGGELIPTAWSEDGEVMALAHCRHPTFGVQFHPESVLTDGGHRLLANFLGVAESFRRDLA